MISSKNATRKTLRKTLREARRGLSMADQKSATEKLLKKLRSHPVFLRSKTIAFYLADDGEIDLHLLIQTAQSMGKHCYLPILHPLNTGHLLFGRYHLGDSLSLSYFGIPEPPVDKKIITAWAIDLVLMPLVGFDRRGNRLGMGGGFYDRTFAFKKNNTRPRSPVLMGMAHSCQEVDTLQNENWDIPLEWIVTDKEIILVN